jgi:hypothetical protein
MAKTASKSQKRPPSGANKPARKGKKKLGSAKGPGKTVPPKAGKRVIDPLPGDDPFEL